MLNAISVDVEEYFHASNLEAVAPPRVWHALESRVDSSTRKVLDIFARTNTKATFFILGYVARRWPLLVKEIAAQGHEIASHGYAHRLAFEQTRRSFYRDVLRTKRLLEDLTGKPVFGYRAPSFSITDLNQWAYDVLIDVGYLYDSSLYPIWHPRYGNRGKSRSPFIYRGEKGEILIIPIAVATLSSFGAKILVPVGGGAYWRFFPLWLIKWGLRHLNTKENLLGNCYFHPWECDANQPYFSDLSKLTKLRHYGGVEQFPSRLETLLHNFKFGPVAQAAVFTLAGEKSLLKSRLSVGKAGL